MTYIGPTRRITPQVRTRPSTGYQPEEGLSVSDEAHNSSLPARFDRRKKGDRRGRHGKQLLDSRSGPDRRKSHAKSISIDI